LACAGTLALLFILIIIPRQYQSSVDQFKAMGTPLAENPLGEIQTVDAQAESFI
jgi:hypothetical protein